jgi:hypothetical protein
MLFPQGDEESEHGELSWVRTGRHPSEQETANYSLWVKLPSRLFLWGPQAKNGFYIFKWLEKNLKDYLMTYENEVKFKLQCPKIKSYE